MKIKNASFIISAYKTEDFPYHDLPEIAFSGRSNVGKSSLINKFVNRKNLAKTSSTPGRTQSINFFNINNQFCLVDLPGYGYAKVPQKVKEEWGQLIEDYLYQRENLRGVVQIVDARHKPTKDDKIMVDWLHRSGIPALIVATKADKLTRNKLQKQKKIIMENLRLASEEEFTFFSAETGKGKNNIGHFIEDII